LGATLGVGGRRGEILRREAAEYADLASRLEDSLGQEVWQVIDKAVRASEL
jgi:hypothetical protein